VEITIDVTSPVYPYVQIADQLREAIARGEITYTVPSLWDIARDAGVSYNTVRRAFKILKDEGVIETIPGRGTFVKRDGQ
jgi:DNA-binding transcriptional regulator YhcF (GntR family)